MLTSERLLNTLTSFDELNRNSEQQVIDRINLSLDRSFDELERTLTRVWGQYGGLNLTAQQRGLLLVNEVQASLQLLNPADSQVYQQRFEQMLTQAGRNGIDMGSILMQSQDSALAATATIPVGAVRAAAEGAVRRLYRHSEEFREKTTVIVTQGLIQGWSAQKAARVMRERLGATKAQAEMVTRTEMAAATNDAAIANYQANGVTYWQFVATGADARTCPVCVARNGNVYDMSTPQPPVHPRCRCYVSPWSTSWQQQGLTNDRWWTNYKAQGVASLSTINKSPNYGLTPFERAAGLTTPPTPVWSPT